MSQNTKKQQLENTKYRTAKTAKNCCKKTNKVCKIINFLVILVLIGLFLVKAYFNIGNDRY